MDSFKEIMKDKEAMDFLKKAAMIAFGLLVALVLVSAVIDIFNGSEDDLRTGAEPVSLTEAEVSEVEKAALKFTQVNTEWGASDKSREAKSVLFSREFADDNSAANSDGQYYLSRKTNYKRFLSPMIYSGSPLSYSDSTLNLWDDEFEITHLTSFEPKSIKVEVDDTGEKFFDGATETKRAFIEVDYVMNHKFFNMVGTPFSEDHAADVMKRESDQSFVLSMVKTSDGVWKAYSLENASAPYGLSTWKAPEDFDKNQNPEDFEILESIDLLSDVNQEITEEGVGD